MSRKSLDRKEQERFDRRKAEAEVDAVAEQAASLEAGSGEEIEAQIHAAEVEAKEHYDKLLRVMAEFENFKKRQAREREELVRFSNEKLLSQLLPALDDLDRVLDHVPVDASEEVKNFAEGVQRCRIFLRDQL